MNKVILNKSKARKKLLIGVNKVADAVAETLGPRGRNITIKLGPNYYRNYHDGVTVAKSIDLKDDFENAGAQQIKEAAIKTNDKAGDGTTTATILARYIVSEAIKNIEAGINPMTLKKEIEDKTQYVLTKLDKMSKKVKTPEEVEQVATISSADPILGKLVAETIDKVGTDGVVTVEEGNGTETTVDYKTGLEFDRGYTSSQFVTNDREESVLDKPYILLTDLDITHSYQIVPFMEKFVKESDNKTILILASSVTEDALATLVINKLRGVVNVCVVPAPAYGGRRVDELEDLAVITGGTSILKDSGRNLDSVEISELGRAEKIVSDRDKTIVISGHGEITALEDRVKELKVQIDNPNSPYDKDIKKQRLAKLSGGVAVIKVGAVSENEMSDKKERIIDAVNATKAAIEEGIVAGGEMALYSIYQSWTEKSILKDALREPFKKLIENAGMDYAETLQKMGSKKYPFGIDVMDGEVKNLIESGIIDPVLVTKTALEKAVGVATAMITTEAIIGDEEDKK